MPASFGVYNSAGTSQGTLSPSAASWQHQVGEDGAGRVTVNGDAAAAVLAETVIVRVNDGTRDVFAFVPTTKNRRQVESSTELDLSGPGVRWLLHAGQVLQEDTTDCAEPSGARWLGWMSDDFDDTAWSTPSSYGQFVSGPWETPRPEGWVDPFAEYLWSSTSANPGNGDVYFRKTFTVASEADYVVCAAGDDEYQLFLDGTEMLSTLGGGPFQWRRFQQRPVKLCAGTHTIAIMGRNLERPVTSTNFGSIIATVLPMNGTTGGPEAHDQKWAVYHDHTGGTFTLSTWFGETTAAIDYNANASAVQSALEAVVGAGNVTVTGSGAVGTPWEITFTGDLSSLHLPLTADGSNLTGGTAIEVDEYVRGGFADPIVRTDTTWKMLAYPADAPGLTPGEILRIVMEEAQARGTTVLDDFSLGFSDTVDSDGNAWDSELTFPVSLPADVHRIAVLVEEMGFPIEVTPTLTLECWNDRGSDLSATVTLAANTAGVTDVQATRDETAVANVIRYRAGDGWHEYTDATSITARGRWEDGLNLDAFPTQKDALPVVQAIGSDLASPPRSTTLRIPSEAATVPYDDFGLGDIITAPAFGTSGYDATDMRVVGISGQVNELSIDWTVELVD